MVCIKIWWFQIQRHLQTHPISRREYVRSRQTTQPNKTKRQKSKEEEKNFVGSTNTIQNHPRPLCWVAPNERSGKLPEMHEQTLNLRHYFCFKQSLIYGCRFGGPAGWSVKVWMCLLSEVIDKFNVACTHKYFLKGSRKNCRISLEKES